MAGHDLGHGFVQLADGCASLTNELHANALTRMEDRRAHILMTEALLGTDHLTPTLQARAHHLATPWA